MSAALKAKAAKAYKSLEDIGCPVMPGGNWSASSLFEISAESGKDAPNGHPWADYYSDGSGMSLGVNKLVEKELAKYGLYCEWINAGVLGVYKG